MTDQQKITILNNHLKQVISSAIYEGNPHGGEIEWK